MRRELLRGFAKLLRFERAAGGVGVGIEMQDDVFAAQVRQIEGLAFVVLEPDTGRRVAYLQDVFLWHTDYVSRVAAGVKSTYATAWPTSPPQSCLRVLLGKGPVTRDHAARDGHPARR